MKNALLIGLSIHDYNYYTIRELELLFENHKELEKNKIQNNIDLAIINAYYTTCFKRTKKLKPLEKYLKHNDKPKKKQTTEEMFNIVEQLNAMYGGEIINGDN